MQSVPKIMHQLKEDSQEISELKRVYNSTMSQYNNLEDDNPIHHLEIKQLAHKLTILAQTLSQSFPQTNNFSTDELIDLMACLI